MVRLPRSRPRLSAFGAAIVLGGVVAVWAARVAADAHLAAPAPTPIVLDRWGAFVTQAGHREGGRIDYGYWRVTPPPRVTAATLALEDRRFWRHPGVDPLAVARAVWSGRSGASTIAMQVARMQHPRQRTLWAKAVEAGVALAITARYGHEAVLAEYFRLAPYGESSHGIGHAARWFFDRPAADLTWAQAALLAAVPQSPTANALRRADSRAWARAARALDCLASNGTIDLATRRAAGAELAAARPTMRPRRPAALAAVSRLEAMARARPADDAPLIRATLDLPGQAAAARIAAADLSGRSGANWSGAEQAAILVLDRPSLAVRVAVGALPGRPGAAADFTAIPRSPGSTLKPFLYADAIDRALLRPDEVMRDVPEEASGIGNADHAFLGPLLPRQALANSRNVPAVALLRRLGLEEGYDYLRGLGLHRGAASARRYGLALAVGALPTRLDWLARAYGALADDGVARDLAWFEDAPPSTETRVMSVDAARLVGRFLADPLARLPSFPRYGALEYPLDVAVKTGTSQGYRDAWTIAWSKAALVAVWVGRADAGPTPRLSGARAAARIAQDVLLDRVGLDRTALTGGGLPSPAGRKIAELCTATAGSEPCAERLSEFVGGATAPTPVAALDIVRPEANWHVWRNPSAPAAMNRILLRAAAPASVRQVEWLCDGVPLATEAPETAVPWALTPGRHRFQVRLPYAPVFSSPVEIVVE